MTRTPMEMAPRPWFELQWNRDWPRTITREQWRTIQQWRRLTQRTLRLSQPNPPTLDFSRGYGIVPLASP